MSKIAEETKAFGKFLTDCRAEVRKITWPKRKELVGSTWIVAALLGLLSAFVFVSDTVLQFILGLATGTK